MKYMFYLLAVYTEAVSIATPNLPDVEEIDYRCLEQVISTAERKKLDPCRIMKSLYYNTYLRVSRILVDELCCEDMKRVARTLITMGLAEADKSELEGAKCIHQLLEVLSIPTLWHDTELLNKLIVELPEEKWRQADELLQRYGLYLKVYFGCTKVIDHPVESKVASETQVTLEITSVVDFNEFSEKDCRDILALLLNVAYQIPKPAVAVNGACSDNSTTVSFLVNKAFIQSIMLKTCTDPLTLWVFLELHISRVRIPGLFEVNVVRLLNLQLATALRSGLNGGADFFGVTTVSNH